MVSASGNLLDRPGVDLDAEFARIVDELTRRGFLAGGLGAAAVLGLSACGTDSSGHSSGSSAWSFTDDSGRTVHLSRTPRRVATLFDDAATTLWPAGLHTVATSMVGGTKELLLSEGASSDEVAAIVPIGAAGGKINLEALTHAQPDLMVAPIIGGKLVTAAPLDTLIQIAPVIGLPLLGASLDQAMQSVRRLTGALGIEEADKQDQREYRSRAEGLQKAMRDSPGLRVGFYWADDTNIYISVVDEWGYLKTLSALGMQFVPAQAASGDFWQTISWENAPSIPVDLLVRWNGREPDSPTWKLLPAVKAGQEIDMSDKWRVTSYAAYAANLAALTTAVADSRPVHHQ